MRVASSFRHQFSLMVVVLCASVSLPLRCASFLPPEKLGGTVISPSRLFAVEKKKKGSRPVKMRKGGSKNKKNKRATTTSKKQYKTKNGPRKSTPGPRPLVTNYEVNRNWKTNEDRLLDDIGCKHFTECSGCSVSKNVGQVDIIQSAKRYFGSTAIRRKRCSTPNYDGDGGDDDNSNFYDVVIPSKVTGWRTQAKLAVAPKSSSSWARDGCIFGLYGRGTHDVLNIPDCAVHHPSINRAVQALERATSKVGTTPYNQGTREGGLRYVAFQVDRLSGKICLTLVWNADSIKETQPSLARLVKELTQQDKADKDLWHSIWVHCNNSIGNNIFHRNPKRWYRLMGPEFVREPIPVGDYGWLYFTPLTFRQGNLDGFDVLANDVARAVPGGSKVCELYAGVGVLGLTALAYHGQQRQDGGNGEPLVWIRLSDENPSNPRCFQRAIDSLPPHIMGRRSSNHNTIRERVDANDDDEEGKGEMTLAEMAAMMESGGQRGGFPTPAERKGDKASYVVASAAAALRAGQALGANVLIVDPPRKGLEDEVLQELCKPFNAEQPCVESATLLTIPDDKVCWTNDVQTLIYVSCGFSALARDTDALLKSPGGWRIESATGYVLFPGSDHVETLCVFQRK